MTACSQAKRSMMFQSKQFNMYKETAITFPYSTFIERVTQAFVQLQ